MSEPLAEPPAALLSSTFVWVELNRRVDEQKHRIDRLDEHGSRGVESLRDEVSRLRGDLEEHERTHLRQSAEQKTARRFTTGTIVALVTPLYPLLIWIITR